MRSDSEMSVDFLREGFREFTLDNGLRVAIQRTPTGTVQGKLRIFHGALHEGEGEEGVAHFLEHVLYAGGGRKFSVDDVARIKRQGKFGEVNAHTTTDHTFLPFGLLPEYLEPCLDLVSDVAFFPAFDPAIVERERHAVINEIGDLKTGPEFRDETAFSKALFGEGPFTLFVAGKQEVVWAATGQDLRDFHSRGYHANNMDLIIVGGIPNDTEEIVRRYLEGKPTGSWRKFQFPPVEPLRDRVVMHTNAPDLCNYEKPEDSKAEIRIGFLAPPLTHDDVSAVSFLSTELGAGEGSRLFERVRNQKQLAYGIGTEYHAADNNAYMEVVAIVSPENVEEAIDAIFEVLEEAKRIPIDDETFEGLRLAIKYHGTKRFETNAARLNAIEQSINTGTPIGYHLANLFRVTQQNVLRMAGKYLPSSRDDRNYVMMIRHPSKE